MADGVHVNVRLGDDKKVCLLVIIGVTETGDKELLAVDPGYGESREGWLTVLRSLLTEVLSLLWWLLETVPLVFGQR